MTEPRIPLYKAFTDQEDLEAVDRVISRGMNWAVGPEIDEFERAVAEYVGRRYAVSFNSGTSALHASMLALGVGEGDEVLVPSFTFIATANCALFVGARPAFADIEKRTYGLDPAELGKALTKKTKVVVPVHIGGVVCEGASEVHEIAREKGVVSVEDACEALGSYNSSKKAGGFGDLSVLSFCANKLISTGEGGMVLTDSKEMQVKLRLILSHGRLDRTPYFSSSESPDYVTIGYNWRISSMTAALGISQMKKLEKAISGRRKVARMLSDLLGGLSEIELPYEPVGSRHTYQMYTVKILRGRKVRDRLNAHLSSKGVTSKIYFDQIHKTKYYRSLMGSKSPRLPATDWASARVLTLPIYPTIPDDDVHFLAESVREGLR